MAVSLRSTPLTHDRLVGGAFPADLEHDTIETIGPCSRVNRVTFDVEEVPLVSATAENSTVILVPDILSLYSRCVCLNEPFRLPGGGVGVFAELNPLYEELDPGVIIGVFSIVCNPSNLPSCRGYSVGLGRGDTSGMLGIC